MCAGSFRNVTNFDRWRVGLNRPGLCRRFVNVVL